MTLSVVALLITSAGQETVLAQGGPPLMTDDPATPGDGHWEINLAVTAEKRESERSFEAPLLDINYGLGERIQLKLELPWLFVREEGNDWKNGLGNSEIGVKWRFLDQQTQWLDASIYPQVEFNNPTSSARRGLVDDGTAWVLPIQMEKSFAGLSVNPEVGYVFLEDEDEWLYGLAVGYSPLDGIELLAEVHGSAELDFHDDELIAQVGCRWVAHRRLTVLGAIGKGFRQLDHDELELVVYVGVQLHLSGDAPEGPAPDTPKSQSGADHEVDHP